MITEQQQETTSLYVLGLLSPEEAREFVSQVRANAELRTFLHSMQRTMDAVALTLPQAAPPPSLKDKVLRRVRNRAAADLAGVQPSQEAAPAGLRFLLGRESSGWKQLPLPGAWIKLLSFQPDRGYAVLLGKLEPGVRYPAHTNAGPEVFFASPRARSFTTAVQQPSAPPPKRTQSSHRILLSAAADATPQSFVAATTTVTRGLMGEDLLSAAR